MIDKARARREGNCVVHHAVAFCVRVGLKLLPHLAKIIKSYLAASRSEEIELTIVAASRHAISTGGSRASPSLVMSLLSLAIADRLATLRRLSCVHTRFTLAHFLCSLNFL